MAASQDRTEGVEAAGVLRNAIAVFEQIVDGMPDDRISLDALVHAYEQLGDRERAGEYLQRLLKVILRDQDAEAACGLRDQALRYRSDERVAAMIEPLEKLAALAESSAGGEARPDEDVMSAPATRDEASSASQSRLHLLDGELKLAYTLREKGLLSEEDYAKLAQDVGDLAMRGGAVTVSALHVLESRGGRGFENMLAAVAEESHSPVMPLSLFAPRAECLRLLPLDFVVRRGAIVFEQISKDALVAVLNPLDETLRRDVKRLLRRECHFFLAIPSEFDVTVERVRTIQQGES